MLRPNVVAHHAGRASVRAPVPVDDVLDDVLGEDVAQGGGLGLQRLDEEVGERGAERVGAAAVLAAEAEEVGQHGAGDLLVVVADHLLGVRQVARHAGDRELRAGGDRGTGTLTRLVLLGQGEAGGLLVGGVPLGALEVADQPLWGGGSLVDGGADTGAVHRQHLDAQHALLQQPRLVAGAQHRPALPRTAAALVGVHDEAVDGDHRRVVLLDAAQTTVTGDVPLADRARRAMPQLPQPGPVTDDPRHDLENTVPIGEGVQRQVEVLGEGEPVARAGRREGVHATHRQAQILGDQLDDVGVRAVRVEPPAGRAERQRDRG